MVLKAISFQCAAAEFFNTYHLKALSYTGGPLPYMFVVLILLSLSLCAQDGLPVGTQAPDFNLPTLDGSHVALSSFLHRNIVVLHFWKTR